MKSMQRILNEAEGITCYMFSPSMDTGAWAYTLILLNEKCLLKQFYAFSVIVLNAIVWIRVFSC